MYMYVSVYIHASKHIYLYKHMKTTKKFFWNMEVN